MSVAEGVGLRSLAEARTLAEKDLTCDRVKGHLTLALAILGGMAFFGGCGLMVSSFVARGVSPLLNSGITLFALGGFGLPVAAASSCTFHDRASLRHRIMEGNHRSEFVSQIRNASTMQELKTLPYYSPENLERYGVMQRDKAQDLYSFIDQYVSIENALNRYEEAHRYALAAEETRKTLEGTDDYRIYTQQKAQKVQMKSDFRNKKADWIAALSTEV